jgi:hypothetical protein
MGLGSRFCIATVGLFLAFACQLAMAQEPQWWRDQKQSCGLRSNLDYQTWTQQGSPCPARDGGS